MDGINFIELTKKLFETAIEVSTNTEVGFSDPLSQYIIYRSGKNITYHIPNDVYLNFNFTELRKRFSAFEVELRSSKQYYQVKVQLI